MSNAAPILETLKYIESGYLLIDMAELQQKIVGHVTDHGGAASMTVKLTYQMDGRNVVVKGVLDEKVPKLSRGTTLFFPTPENNLTRNDPRQKKLELEPETRETHIDMETGEITLNGEG